MKVSDVKANEMVTKYEKIELDNKAVKQSMNEVKEVEITDKAANNEKNVREAVEKINKHLEASNTTIKFKIHDSEFSLNNKVSIKVVDEESEKVIAEIPSEEAIELSERMHQIIGFLFDASK